LKCSDLIKTKETDISKDARAEDGEISSHVQRKKLIWQPAWTGLGWR